MTPPFMTPRQIDTYCGTLPAATRTVQWEGVIVFKVGGKMFCLIAPPDHSVGRVCFKCQPWLRACWLNCWRTLSPTVSRPSTPK